jgi:mono/diheme cytochrome c family protein
MARLCLGAGLAFVAIVGALGASAAAPTPVGAALFENNCQVCHQAGGVGVAGQYPRLAGRAPVIAASADGRAFLPKLVLNGMSGSVTVDNQSIIGVMPGFSFLSDAELAAVLTYVSGLGAEKGRPKAFKPADIAAARGAEALSPGAIVTLRNRLAADKVIP